MKNLRQRLNGICRGCIELEEQEIDSNSLRVQISEMSSIKVAVRCRPWTKDDKLGVHMIQNGEEEGEINLLNSDYSTKRFAFRCTHGNKNHW